MYKLTLWAEKATFRTADIVISTNQSYKNIAIRRGGVDPKKVFVVRSGPSKTLFNPVPPKNEFKNGKKYLVCYLGVMGPHDGVDLLLKAIHYVVNSLKRVDIQFTLIGDGDTRPKLLEMTKKLNLENWVTFTGRIPDEKVIEYLSTSDLCVAPDPKDSLNDLSTMNKIMEYMAIEKPIIAFDLKETRASADQSALYAKPNDWKDFGDKIVALLEQPTQREWMGKFARERFLKVLCWECQKRELLHAYSVLFPN